MSKKQFIVPMIGKMLNWETFSGNSEDHVRPLGVLHFKIDTAETESMMQTVLSYDVDVGSCLIQVEADQSVLDKITSWVASYTNLNDMAIAHGQECLKRDPAVDKKPDLRFTELNVQITRD